jgi:thiol-disulfide isomerase/thioredoxin
MLSSFTNKISSLVTPLKQYGGSEEMSKVKIIGYVVVFLFFVFISLMLYRNYKTSSFNANYEHGKTFSEESCDNDGNSGGDQNKGDCEVIFFYVDWCPHCKTAKPEFEKFSKDNQNIKVNGYNVIIKEIDCTQETQKTADLMDKYNIEGFPTIIMLKDGEEVQFDAKPTNENLTQFVNTATKNNN